MGHNKKVSYFRGLDINNMLSAATTRQTSIHKGSLST